MSPAGVSALDRAITAKAIGDTRWRERVRVRGRVRAPARAAVGGRHRHPRGDHRRRHRRHHGDLHGPPPHRRVKLGAWIEVEGMVLESRGKLAIMNPEYLLLTDEKSPR